MNDALLLIDFNNLFYKFTQLTNLSLSWNGRSTSGIYGFITQFAEQVNSIKPEYVIVCSDSKPYIRTKMFTSYKSNRNKCVSGVDPELIKDNQFNRDMCYEFLGMLGLSLWTEKGLEADDLIAIACNKYQNSFRRIVVSSNDSDLYQLLKSGNVCIRKKVKNKFMLYSKTNFKEEFGGITTKQYIKYLAIKGTHNYIPGIEGYGKVKALKIVKDNKLLEELYTKHKDTLLLYERLIRLPFTNVGITVPELKKVVYKERQLLRFMIDLGIDFTKSMSNAFGRLTEWGI